MSVAAGLRKLDWRRLDTKGALEQMERDGATHIALWEGNSFRAIVSRDPYGTRPDGSPDLRWHVSVSHRERVPDWGELVDIVHRLRPGVAFVVGIPPRSHWMNLHPFVLHAIQVRDDNLTRRWMQERAGTPPT